MTIGHKVVAMIRFAFLLLALALARPALAQDLPKVRLDTSAGAIVIAVDTARAPVTSANFLRYVDQKRFDGFTFYRALKLGETGGLIQGGTRGDRKKTLPPIAHEATTQTGLSHVDGAVSMARFAPGTAAGDFFIAVGPIPGLDADPAQSGDNAGYAVFGQVVEGMEAVRAILAAPISETAGADVGMKGQMIAQPIRIVTARRLP
jgi:peptidyl-prolyl cis-trans isomerase A (cyclophilin A)